MKMRSKIFLIIFMLTLFLASSPTFSAIVYDNFGSGDTFNDSGGWIVGSTMGYGDIASKFSTSGFDHHFTGVELALSLPAINPADDIYAWILTDDSGSPGTVIQELFYNGVIPPNNAPGIIELASSNNIVLAADSTYWIAVGRTPAYFSGATPANVVWHLSLTAVGDIGEIYSRNPEQDWSYFGNYNKGAFKINGNPLKFYDDFSTGYIDGAKWRQREYVREIVDGEFVFKLGNRSPGMGAEILPGLFRNNLPFANPETIDTIEVDVAFIETQLDSAPGSKSSIGIHGRFYNTNEGGGATGNIIAQLMIGEQGNGKVEAFWEVWEVLSDDNSTWDVIAADTIDAFDSAIVNPPYNLKVHYNGDKTFTFTINDTYADSYTGPDRRRDAVGAWKEISAIIRADDGSNNGYVYGKIDNVFINNDSIVYDDFSSPMIDLSKWRYDEFVREASNGYLRANSLGIGSTDSTTTHLSYSNAPYLEAKVRIDSSSQLSAGAIGVGRIQGYYYNDRRGPGSGQDFNQYEGDVFAQVRLRYDSNGTLSANAYVDRSDDANESSFTNLFSHDFTVPINLDTFYTLSIQLEGSQLSFGCDDETVAYHITTPMYPAYGVHRHLSSRVYLDPGETGYINASYDDVKVETCLCDLQPLDGDVDGFDIVAYIADDEGISLREFANEFGKINCP